MKKITKLRLRNFDNKFFSSFDLTLGIKAHSYFGTLNMWFIWWSKDVLMQILKVRAYFGNLNMSFS